ncbi:Hypothetical protein, putative [Bodo saltans]|uniref:Uncharacterized protein n=1 Tax=Bodo saltans TaxID=75058 RepID=A0A0S4ILI3_BODSA|nr:Hypothetical protein, putative [Bodo saltans]|eukprot:CUE56275.1 Hypothetical protein, putative [Bodo saltans]
MCPASAVMQTSAMQTHKKKSCSPPLYVPLRNHRVLFGLLATPHNGKTNCFFLIWSYPCFSSVTQQ